MAYSVSLITLQPPPTFLVEIPESVNPHWPRIEWVGLLKDAASLIEPVISWIDLARFRFTGVSWDRFEVVCSTGIDVTPTDSTIYVAEFEKALEYGDWPKVIIAFALSNSTLRFGRLRLIHNPSSSPNCNAYLEQKCGQLMGRNFGYHGSMRMILT